MPDRSLRGEAKHGQFPQLPKSEPAPTQFVHENRISHVGISWYLKLDSIYVVYPGAQRFSLSAGVEAVPLWALMPSK